MATEPLPAAPPPRVLVIMPDQWTRALVRAALREVGYDAVGTRGVREAFRARPSEPGRGPVRLLIVDHDAMDTAAAPLIEQLLARHASPDAILIRRATKPEPNGPWRVTLRRPLSVADIVSAAETQLPLAAAARRPIDEARD